MCKRTKFIDEMFRIRNFCQQGTGRGVSDEERGETD